MNTPTMYAHLMYRIALDRPIHGVYNASQFTLITLVPKGGIPVSGTALHPNVIILVLALIIRYGVPPGVPAA
jgi:hypothetical protein